MAQSHHQRSVHFFVSLMEVAKVLDLKSQQQHAKLLITASRTVEVKHILLAILKTGTKAIPCLVISIWNFSHKNSTAVYGLKQKEEKEFRYKWMLKFVVTKNLPSLEQQVNHTILNTDQKTKQLKDIALCQLEFQPQKQKLELKIQ